MRVCVRVSECVSPVNCESSESLGCFADKGLSQGSGSLHKPGQQGSTCGLRAERMPPDTLGNYPLRELLSLPEDKERNLGLRLSCAAVEVSAQPGEPAEPGGPPGQREATLRRSRRHFANCGGHLLVLPQLCSLQVH